MNKTLKNIFRSFLCLPLSVFLDCFLIPFVIGLYLSFTSFTTVTNAQWTGFENYIKAFTADESFLNSLLVYC